MCGCTASTGVLLYAYMNVNNLHLVKAFRGKKVILLEFLVHIFICFEDILSFDKQKF